MSLNRKPLGWLAKHLQTPPIGKVARREAGYLLQLLQEGETVPFPESRPMPSIGRRVHELRLDDPESRLTWRIFYRIDPDAILVIDWVPKKTQKTPKSLIHTCKLRLRQYDLDARKGSRR